MHPNTDPAQPKIAIRDLHKRFDGAPLNALEHIHLDIAPNEFVTFVGASGCGKSTLLRTIGGLETHTSGELLVDGQPVKGPDIDRAMVFQHYSLYPWLTVMENIKFSRQLKINRENLSSADVEAASGRADALLNLIGLNKVRDAYPNQLSGGMQQRVAIARALALQPRLILADEPTGNLDTVTADEVFALLREFNHDHGSACLIVTHDPRLAARCDRQIVLVDGQLTAQG